MSKIGQNLHSFEKILSIINWELFRQKGKIIFQPYTNQLPKNSENFQNLFSPSNRWASKKAVFTSSNNVKNPPFCAYVCGIF